MDTIVDRFQSAFPSGNSFVGRNKVSDHLAFMFKYLQGNQAKSQVVNISPVKFLFTHTFESLRPVTQYLVDSEGIYLIPFLENCITTMKVEVDLKVKSNKICKIQIAQKNIFLCKSGAQNSLTFVPSTLKQYDTKIPDYAN
jgi:hypothetical protein